MGIEVGSACGVCNSIASKGNYRVSERCCTCWHCHGPLGKDIVSSHYHRICEDLVRRQMNSDRMAAAELVTDYAGPIFTEEYDIGGWGEGFYCDIEELRDYLMEDEYPPDIEFAYCCKPRHYGQLDLGSILEDACEDLHDQACTDFEGTEELQKAIELFIKSNINHSPEQLAR